MPQPPNRTARRRAIGRAIHDRRRAMKITQERLAARLGITDDTLRSWERGKHDIPASMLFDIADALDSYIEDLLAGDE